LRMIDAFGPTRIGTYPLVYGTEAGVVPSQRPRVIPPVLGRGVLEQQQMLSVVCIQGSSEEIFPRTRLAWSPVALIQLRGWIALSYPVHGTCARRGDLSACKSRSRKIVAWHRIFLVQHQPGVFNIEI